MRRRILTQAAALLGYVGLSLAYLYPIVPRLRTHLLGKMAEIGNNLWNMWYFRYAIVRLHDNPFWTDMQYWPHGANLLTLHYTLSHDLLAFWMVPRLGIELFYNASYIGLLALSGYAVFLILSDRGYEPGVAFPAGALFAFSTTLAESAMFGRGLDWCCSAAIALFVWAFLRLLRRRTLGYAALSAALLTWTWGYNFYFFLGCALFIPFCYVWQERPLTLALGPRQGRLWKSLRRLTDAALLLAAAGLVYALARGQREFHGSGSPRELVLYVLPYAVFWTLLGARFLWTYALTPRWRAAAWRWRALSPYVAVLSLWAAVNWTMALASLRLMRSGSYGKPPSPAWRGGGNPTDLVGLFWPSIHHPLWGDRALRLGQALGATTGPSHSMFALVPVALVIWLWSTRPRGGWISLWTGAALFYFTLCLGPWLRVCGIHTYLPLPFYALHLLPVFNNMPGGHYFCVFVMLFLSLLFAAALHALRSHLSPRLAAWLPGLALLAVAAECATKPQPLCRIDPPRLVRRLRDLPEGVFLPIPVSANFHVVANPGPVGHEFVDLMSYQPIHQHPYIGGFLSRPSRRSYDGMMADPVFRGLLQAQEGGPLSAVLQDPLLMSRYFRDQRIRYLLVESSLLPPAVLGLVGRWPLRELDREGGMRLYEVVLPPSATEFSRTRTRYR